MDFIDVSPERVEVVIKNKKTVQNHIGTVHAVAAALAAEASTGFLVASSLPDSNILLLQSMNVKYIKLCQGDIRAVATFQPDQIEKVRTLPKSDILVPVKVTDSSGQVPILCEMRWAWLPKKTK
eukprot:Sdes_comp10217_c0_seq1m1835